MPTLTIRNWFGRAGPAPPPPMPDEEPAHAITMVLPDRGAWPNGRLRVTDTLWGDGFQFSGGEIEVLRLAKPLGLSAASSLLLLGAGGGGASIAIAARLGVWVNGFDADDDLIAAAHERLGRTKLGRRVQIASWNPADPEFTRHYYHHGLALEPLRGHQPEPTLSAVASALKPGGQFALVELVADTPLSHRDPDVARWAKLERRDAGAMPSETTITRVLGRLGFDVRIAEDISRRHVDQALLGWRTRVRALEEEETDRRAAAFLVAEAEFWMVRLRLFRAGQVRMVRWHAIARGVG